MNKRMKELPPDVRPYEKGRIYGVESLSDTELLAVLLRSGTKGMNSLTLSEKLLQLSDGSLSGLFRMDTAELLKIPGIGEVKALQIRAVQELAKRIVKSRLSVREDFVSPAFTASYYMEDLRSLGQEEVRAVYLNSRGKRIGEETVSRGSASESMFPVREILSHALKSGAVNLLLLHNHPGGDPMPSEADVEATRRIEKAAVLSGIRLIDHIIIGDGVYFSMRSEGLIK